MDAICQFLIASATLCQATWALHSGDEEKHSVENHDLTDKSLNLRHAIQSILDTTLVTTDESTALVHACRKVGHDLVIRLDRSEELVHSSHAQESRLYDIWTQDVIGALATQLVALVRQYQAISIESE